MIRMAWQLELNENVLEELYVWIDSIPLSKPKKRIERDFSDGVLVAEIVRNYLPDLIDVHNYTTTSAFNQKRTNWGILNKKVFSRLGFDLPESILLDLCHGKAGKIEILLFNLKLKIDEELELRQKVEPVSQFSSTSPRQSSTSINLDSIQSKPKLIKQTSRSIGNLSSRWVSRLDYEELRQTSFQQQEDIEILQAKIRRLEHILQLKELKIKEILALLDEQKYSNRPNYLINNRKKK